ncbi:MAG: PEP-CTERM sorting domain-containing protein [Planctomycetota bacterium]|nr:MAG: PEP-CTERM sorting domain-containing protein [Planctomycetota bacterium]
MRAINARSIAALLATAFAVAASTPCHAVTISYVGTEPGVGPNFATQNWSNSAVPKAYATGTSNTYGKNGYWQIRPIPYAPSSTIYSAAAAANDLGTSAGSFPTLWSGTLPAFMSSITGGAGDFVNFNSYAIYRGPDGSALYTQGGLSVPVNQGPYNTPSGANTGYFGLSADMVLNFSGTVRVGIAVDSVADGTYAPNYVSIYSNSTGTVYSSVLTRDGTPDMAVFDIVNPAGETFSVAQWQLAGTQSASAMSLVTFDTIVVPEPSSVALIAIGGVAVAAGLRRRRR